MDALRQQVLLHMVTHTYMYCLTSHRIHNKAVSDLVSWCHMPKRKICQYLHALQEARRQRGAMRRGSICPTCTQC